jgi:hypothetical protein
MNAQAALTIFDIISLIMICAVIIIHGLAAFWNIKFLIVTEWQTFSWIKVYSASVCIFVAVAYAYLIIKFMMGDPVDTSLFGAVIVRPLVFLMGGAFASSAEARLTSLKNGGNEKWILRKSKI